MAMAKVLLLILCVVRGLVPLLPTLKKGSMVVLSAEDDAAKRQARRAAIIAASERAAQRMQAVQQGLPVPEPVEEPRYVEEQPRYVEYDGGRPTEDPAERRRAIQEASQRAAARMSEMQAAPPAASQYDIATDALSRAPDGYQPYYNTGEGYLEDLKTDSINRHWSRHGQTAGLETIERQFGQRPGQNNNAPPYSQEKKASSAPPPPTPTPPPPHLT